MDNQGRIYVIYPLSHLAKDLGCCVSSVTRSFAELEKAELAERVRSGFSKPSHILLKVPHTVQNCAVTVCTSTQSDCAETHSMVAQKCTPNQRNKNNLKDNHLIRANRTHLSLGEYQNVFLTEKEYKRLKGDPGPLLAPWYNRREIALTHDENCEGILFQPQLVQRVVQGFDFLIPYYAYFLS